MAIGKQHKEHQVSKQVSQVRSSLASSERNVTEQCTATTTQNMRSFPGFGTTVRCSRPVNAHRVHEALGFFQWDR
jgi:hypothetical protein